MMYSIKAYPTEAYNIHETIYRDFKDARTLWQWCRHYLSLPNRKVIVHRLEKRYRFGDSRQRHPEYVKKIGIFTSAQEIPGWLLTH